ncbi:MAG: amidohydrolase family protein [Gammaproteobacteria bacterium]
MWRGIKLISDDSHFEGSPDQWRGYVAPEFRKYVPEVIELPGGGNAWKLFGREEPVPLGLNLAMGRGWENLKLSGISYSDKDLVGAGDGRQRLREMDRDGVDAEVIYAPVAALGSRYGNLPRQAQAAVAMGYNDFLSKEYCAADPDRLLGLAVLPNTSVEDNIAELIRLKGMPGIRGVSLQMWPNGGPTPMPEDDRFWKVAVEHDMPLTTHFAFGGGHEAETAAKAANVTTPSGQPLNWCPINRLLTRVGAGSPGVVNVGFCVIQMITEGIFDRFPTLRLSMAECGAGWVAPFMEAADSNYMRHHHWARVNLPHEPSWYVKRHFLFGVQDDFLAVRELRDVIGVDALTWGTDFPHVASDWPHSHALLDRMFDGVPLEATRRIVGGNLARHLRLDVEKVRAAA